MLFPTSLVGSYCPARLADRPRQAEGPVPAPHPRQGAVAHPRGVSERGAGRRHPARDPRCRRRPGSTSSPTARSGARATRTASPPRSTALDLDNYGEVHRPARASRSRCRASPARSAAARPVEVEDLKFLRAHTDRKVKITLPGPFTMSQQAVDDHYGDPRERRDGLCRAPCARRSPISSPPAPMSCSSTSPGCRPARPTPRNTGWRR